MFLKHIEFKAAVRNFTDSLGLHKICILNKTSSKGA